MEILPHISSPFSETWVAWLLFGIGMVSMTIIGMNPQVAKMEFKSLFSRSNRNYTQRSNGILAGILVWICYLAEVSIWVQVLLYNGTIFTIGTFVKILGISASVTLLSYLVSFWIEWMCLNRSQRDIAQEQNHSFVAIQALVMFPFLIVMINWPTHLMTIISTWLCLWVIVGLFMIKFYQLFVHKVTHIFYGLLYILCLKLLPFGVIWNMAQQILQQ